MLHLWSSVSADKSDADLQRTHRANVLIDYHSGFMIIRALDIIFILTTQERVRLQTKKIQIVASNVFVWAEWEFAFLCVHKWYWRE